MSVSSGTGVRSVKRVDGRSHARLLGLVAGAALLIVLAGCGSSTPTLNSARVQRAVAASIASQRGIHATVSCPSKVPQKAGHSFSCVAHLEVGTYPVTVVEINGSGRVRYESRQPLVALNIAKVQRAITASIARQRKLAATVTCPAQVLQKAGLVFTCMAVIKGKTKRYPFVVTEVNDKGNVRYIGR